MSASAGDSAMAFARVAGPIGSDRADLHICRDLAEQFGQHGRVTNMAAGDLDSTDLQRLFVDAYMDLAP